MNFANKTNVRLKNQLKLVHLLTRAVIAIINIAPYKASSITDLSLPNVN